MGCENTSVMSLANALVNWDVAGVGEIVGFAEGENVIEISFADEIGNTIKVSGDGRTGIIESNGKSNGTATLKLHPSSPYVGIFNDLFLANKTTRGDMTVADVETGATWELECAVMMKPPNQGLGTKVPDSYDFPFLFVRSTYDAPRNSVAAIVAG